MPHAIRRLFSRRRPVVQLCAIGAAAAAVAALVPSPSAQALLDKTERDRAKQMLKEIERTIKDHYYDRAYRGIELAGHFEAAKAKIDTAVSIGHAYAVIAQALIDFDDSHLFFIPPPRPNAYEYGWHMQMVGDECLVMAVRPGSDADAKGLKPGDRVLRIEAFTPTRRDLWKARYLYQVLSPRSALTLVVQTSGASPRTLSIAARVTPGRKVIEIGIENILEGQRLFDDEEPLVERHRIGRIGDIALWKLAGFDFDASAVDRLVDDVVKDASSLVIDMRGNGGGSVKTLEQITRRLFDRDVKIADLKGRRSMKPLVAKKRKSPFGGKVVVLVDAESGSAAEVLARVVQIEKRGAVIGDRSSGSVMQSRQMMAAIDIVDGFIPYGVSVTDADLLMTDGKSLEHVGVVPDEVLLPSAADLAAGRDPVLARGVAILGGTLDPLTAGRMFPVEWKAEKAGTRTGG
jgi:carboxyl-terminal processing protease